MPYGGAFDVNPYYLSQIDNVNAKFGFGLKLIPQFVAVAGAILRTSMFLCFSLNQFNP
jgi:hypothetical protein